MERAICLENIRKGVFPAGFQSKWPEEVRPEHRELLAHLAICRAALSR